jgi:hypothetical protein
MVAPLLASPRPDLTLLKRNTLSLYATKGYPQHLYHSFYKPLSNHLLSPLQQQKQPELDFQALSFASVLWAAGLDSQLIHGQEFGELIGKVVGLGVAGLDDLGVLAACDFVNLVLEKRGV